MEELTPITRREVFLAKASGQEVETPTPVTREEVFLDAIAKGGGGKKFIVTLTPTAEDFSGTMDKTVAEINAAYEAGQQVVFRVYLSETTYNDVDIGMVYTNTSSQYPSYNGFMIDYTNHLLIDAYTGATNDGTKQTYATTIYALTPAS